MWSGTDRIFCHFEPFLPFYPPNNPENQNFEKMKKMPRYIIILNMFIINENHMMYSSWDMEHNRNFFLILDPFTPLAAQKENQNFEKMKKTPGDIIILHKCTTNENHMRYGTWDMKHDRHNFLSFGAFFCPFTPLTTQKIKLLKKWKTSLEVSSFKCTKNHDHMLYCSWDMACDGFNC